MEELQNNTNALPLQDLIKSLRFIESEILLDIRGMIATGRSNNLPALAEDYYRIGKQEIDQSEADDKPLQHMALMIQSALIWKDLRRNYQYSEKLYFAQNFAEAMSKHSPEEPLYANARDTIINTILEHEKRNSPETKIS